MSSERTIIFEGESPYGRYKVVDTLYNDRKARVLYGDRRSPQSGAARDENPELLFDYNQRFLEMIMSVRPKKVLVIGGGAFMLPIAAYHRFSDITFDVVEIDQLLVDISYEHFDLPRDKRMRVHVMDGAEFVQGTKEKYDLIIIDAFSGYTIPPHLLEENTLKQYKRHLSRKGIVTINFISEYKPQRFRLAHELMRSFSALFPHCALFQADDDYPRGEEQNLLLAASNKPFHFDYLHSQELDLYE